MIRVLVILVIVCTTLVGKPQSHPEHFDYIKLLGIDTVNFNHEHFISLVHNRYWYNIPGIYILGSGYDMDRPWVIDNIQILWMSNTRRWCNYTPWEMEEMLEKHKK